MKKKRKTFDDWEYSAAANASNQHNYLPLNEDGESIGSDEHLFFVMPKDAKSPEDLLIKKENLEDLSDDAREVIALVLQMKAELEVSPKKYKIYKVVTKRQLQKLLRKKWRSKKRANGVLKELTNWADSLG